MTIELGTYSGEKNAVNKGFNVKNTLQNVVLKDQTSIIEPTFILRDSVVDDIGINYVYAPDFKRYYFIKNISKSPGGMVEVACHVDVLMSHREAINGLVGIVARQENAWNLYLNTDSIPDNAYRRVQTIRFPNMAFNGYSLVLCTNGTGEKEQ